MTDSSRRPATGEIWDLELDPVTGHEQGGRRPALVVSSGAYNHMPNGLTIVVPLTGTERGLRIHLPIDPPEGGITKRSVIMCDQVRSVSQLRFRRRRGQVTTSTLDRVQQMVSQFIDR